MSLLLKVEHISYTMGTHALPNICTLALRQMRIYQAKHLCPLHRLISYIEISYLIQCKVENTTTFISPYGPQTNKVLCIALTYTIIAVLLK